MGAYNKMFCTPVQNVVIVGALLVYLGMRTQISRAPRASSQTLPSASKAQPSSYSR